MRWFSFSGLKFLVSEIKGRELLNMQAINNTFNEVYDIGAAQHIWEIAIAEVHI